jgi:hypothetical protein
MSEKDLKRAERILGEIDETTEAEQCDNQMSADNFNAAAPCWPASLPLP